MGRCFIPQLRPARFDALDADENITGSGNARERMPVPQIT